MPIQKLPKGENNPREMIWTKMDEDFSLPVIMSVTTIIAGIKKRKTVQKLYPLLCDLIYMT